MCYLPPGPQPIQSIGFPWIVMEGIVRVRLSIFLQACDNFLTLIKKIEMNYKYNETVKNINTFC